MAFESRNPTNGEVFRTFDGHTPDQVADILTTTGKAQESWRRVPLDERIALLRRTGEVLRSGADASAELMAMEMGKPVADGRSEVEKCAWLCDYYADNATRFLADEHVETDASESFVTYQPLGVVLAVMPWNFPFWQVFRFAIPNLIAGNGGVLKHAQNVFGSALAIEETFREAGLPEDIFRTLLISSDQVKSVIEHDVVRAVTLTGSTGAGRAVAGLSGAALKKTVLELGGSDPYLILEDADLETAVPTCVTSRLINAGQSCIAAKRFVVVESVREEFEDRFIAEMQERTMGDPLDEANDLGPQARHDLRDELHDQVERGIAAGARCALGGEIPDGPGAFYPPTVLTDVTLGTPAADEELFGPVASIMPVADGAEAIRVANASPFGLGAAVFTRDIDRGRKIAAYELEAGCCFVNELVRSDPRLPFGGVKESGYGRELAEHGMKEFLNAKTVYIG